MIMLLEADLDRLERLLMLLRDHAMNAESASEPRELLARLALARRGYPKATDYAQTT